MNESMGNEYLFLLILPSNDIFRIVKPVDYTKIDVKVRQVYASVKLELLRTRISHILLNTTFHLQKL